VRALKLYWSRARLAAGSALCIVHPIPSRPAAALPGPNSPSSRAKPPSGLFGRGDGQIAARPGVSRQRPAKLAKLKNGRRFNSFVGVCGASEIQRNSRRPAVEPRPRKMSFLSRFRRQRPAADSARKRRTSMACEHCRQSRTNADRVLPFNPSKPL
jgi:hypothetical protein